MTSNQKLAGKIALVTGGSSGIGLATAKQLAAEGAHVFITGRRKPELEAAAREIGPSATPIAGDISVMSDIDRIVSVMHKTKGRVDIIFANAGGGEFRPLGEITETHFDKTFDINVKGTLFTVQKTLPLMPNDASIILNASITASKGVPSFSVYAATKAAVRSFARSWSVDLKERRIRVNAISPGPVPTPGYDSFGFSAEEMEGWLAMQSSLIPLGRVGKPEEIAKAVVFLASEDSSYVNGIELFVDGGMAQI